MPASSPKLLDLMVMCRNMFKLKYRICDHCGSEYTDDDIATENKNNFLKRTID